VAIGGSLSVVRHRESLTAPAAKSYQRFFFHHFELMSKQAAFTAAARREAGDVQ